MFVKLNIKNNVMFSRDIYAQPIEHICRIRNSNIFENSDLTILNSSAILIRKKCKQ